MVSIRSISSVLPYLEIINNPTTQLLKTKHEDQIHYLDRLVVCSDRKLLNDLCLFSPPSHRTKRTLGDAATVSACSGQPLAELTRNHTSFQPVSFSLSSLYVFVAPGNLQMFLLKLKHFFALRQFALPQANSRALPIDFVCCL